MEVCWIFFTFCFNENFFIILSLFFRGNFFFDYSHENPEKWPGVCQTGSAQSPINIAEVDLEEVDDYEPFIFHGYDTMPCDTSMVKNDGHSVVMDYSEGLDYHFPYFSLHIGQTIPTLTGGKKLTYLYT